MHSKRGQSLLSTLICVICVYVPVWFRACLPLSVCVCLWHHTCLTSPLPSWPHSRAQQHVNGGRRRQSCPRGAGGAPGLGSCLSHPESEPHPDSPSDAHQPVAGSSGSRSHQEPQPQPLQHSLAHTGAEVRLPPHTQHLSHDQGREGSAGLCREAPQAHRATFPQNSSAGKT